jgi:hypothetical protein
MIAIRCSHQIPFQQLWEVAMKTGLALNVGAWIILLSVIPYVLAAYIPIYVRSSIYRFLSAADHNSLAPRVKWWAMARRPKVSPPRARVVPLVGTLLVNKNTVENKLPPS